MLAQHERPARPLHAISRLTSTSPEAQLTRPGTVKARLTPKRPRKQCRLTRLCAWCDGPIPAKAWLDAVCCSVRCHQARHRFLRTGAGLPLGRKTLAGYQELGPSLSSRPPLVRSTGSVEPEIAD